MAGLVGFVIGHRSRVGRVALSEHFTAAEWACPCCGQIVCDRGLASLLEVARARFYVPRGHRGLVIRSGYRCPAHNKAVGGARESAHLEGRAADVDACMTLAEARSVRSADGRRFGGIGVRKSTGLVVHVDTGAPRTWYYDEQGNVI